nr:mitogen-activated protein kinase 16 [Tanacetum cinerariifolium]
MPVYDTDIKDVKEEEEEIIGKRSYGRPLFPRKNVVHQLDIMTDMLGTPTSEALTRIQNEKARRYLSNMRKKPEIPFSHKFSNVDPLDLYLLESLLSFDLKDQTSAEDVLADPYF